MVLSQYFVNALKHASQNVSLHEDARNFFLLFLLSRISGSNNITNNNTPITRQMSCTLNAITKRLLPFPGPLTARGNQGGPGCWGRGPLRLWQTLVDSVDYVTQTLSTDKVGAANVLKNCMIKQFWPKIQIKSKRGTSRFPWWMADDVWIGGMQHTGVPRLPLKPQQIKPPKDHVHTGDRPEKVNGNCKESNSLKALFEKLQKNACLLRWKCGWRCSSRILLGMLFCALLHSSALFCTLLRSSALFWDARGQISCVTIVLSVFVVSY